MFPTMRRARRTQRTGWGNDVQLRCGTLLVLLAHFASRDRRRDRRDTGFRRGQLLGRIGNSGVTQEPHLHVSAMAADSPIHATSGRRTDHVRRAVSVRERCHPVTDRSQESIGGARDHENSPAASSPTWSATARRAANLRALLKYVLTLLAAHHAVRRPVPRHQDVGRRRTALLDHRLLLDAGRHDHARVRRHHVHERHRPAVQHRRAALGRRPAAGDAAVHVHQPVLRAVARGARAAAGAARSARRARAATSSSPSTTRSPPAWSSGSGPSTSRTT